MGLPPGHGLRETEKGDRPLHTHRGLDRRRFLQLGLGAAGAFIGAPALAGNRAKNIRELAFKDTHTGEFLKTAYWVDGNYEPEALAAIDHLLRDFRTGDVHPIDGGLLDYLYALHDEMDTHEPFHVISGYRSPKTNATLAAASGGVAKKSLHMKGMAIDIRIPGRRLKDLRAAAISLRRGGVGYYPGSDFVHVDVGRVRSW